MRAQIYRLGARMRDGLEAIGAEAGVPVLASGYGSLFVLLEAAREALRAALG